MPRRDQDSLTLGEYKDAALAKNGDLAGQIGFANALSNWYGKANPVEFSSRKCRRVMQFSAGFDAGYMLKHDILGA